jgi:hypothetical protein
MSLRNLLRIAFFVFASNGSAFASEEPNRYGVIVDWEDLIGHYQGRTAPMDQTCEVEVSLAFNWLGRPLLSLAITNQDGEHMSFEAPLAHYKASLKAGNYSAGTAAYAEKSTGFTLGVHTTTYGKFNFTEPSQANAAWPIRGVNLSWTEADFYLVIASQQLSCWDLVKTDQ